jgi:hypothetical protein
LYKLVMTLSKILRLGDTFEVYAGLTHTNHPGPEAKGN